MSLVVSHASPGGRAGELTVWGFAGLAVLAAHLGAGLLLMQARPEAPPDGGPPAAIMIELAPEPVAANTQDEQLAPDTMDQQAVQSQQTQPVQDPPPQPVEQARAEPAPEPPEPSAEPSPSEPVQQQPEPMPEPPLPEPPEPQMTQTIPEPLPEPVVPPEPIAEPIPEPIREQPTAAMDNVEVPLPMMRPPMPAMEKPRETPRETTPRKQQARKEKPKPQQQQQQQARKDRAEARLQAKDANRTAASQNSTGFISPSVTPARWKSQVQARVARNASRCPAGGVGSASVRFSFDGSGNVTNVSLQRSSGNAAIDAYIVSAVRRASPIPAPPPGVAKFFDQLLACQ